MSSQQELTIPLGRRIGEIMEEKGDAFSYRALSERIGMSKDILSRIINGKRYIKPSELEKICKALGISKVRLKQEDISEEIQDFEEILFRKNQLDRALTIGKMHTEVALGITEKCQAWINLGRVYYELKQYDFACEVWSKAHEYAQQVYDKYGEKKMHRKIIKNLFLTYANRKDYNQIQAMAEEVEALYHDMPQDMGPIYYTFSRIAEENGDTVEAKKRIYQSYESFIQAGDRINTGISMINVAHYEYKSKDYEKAKEMLAQSLSILSNVPNKQWFAIARKEYARVLLVLGEQSECLRNLKEAIQDPEMKKYPQVYAKLHILHVLVESNVDHVKKVLQLDAISDVL